MKQFLLLINLLCFFGCSRNETGPLKNKEIIQTNSIITANPSELNINDSILNDLTEKITSQYYPNIHSVLIAKEGKLIYEEYFQGKDQNFGKDIGVRVFGDTSLHDIRSISKSVVSAMIGISIDKGIIKGVDQPIAIFFPEMKFDDAKRNWTISHFLTMSSGLDWNENVPYNNPLNDEIKMTYSDDPVRYVLEKPLIAEPGKMFNYSGGDTQILAEIVERASKMTINEFAKENLFKSLQISEFKWNKYAMWGGSEKFAAPSG